MRLHNYLIEGKWMQHPMIGFGINPADLTGIKTYLKEQLIQENIRFKDLNDNHLTISQFFGQYDKADLVRATNSISTKLVFKGQRLDLFRGKRVKHDFIVASYKPNKKFVDDVEKLGDEFAGSIKWEMVIPHVSLFTVKRGTLSDKVMKSIADHAPKLKSLKPTEVQLWNQRHQKEYTK